MCGWSVHFFCIYTYIYITLSRRLSLSYLFMKGIKVAGPGGEAGTQEWYRRESQTYTHTYTIQSSGAVTQTHTHTRYSLHPAAGPYIGRWVAHLWECLKRKDSYGCPGVASVSSPAVAVRNCLPQAKHPQNRHNLPLKPEAHNNVHEYGATMPYYSLRSQ